jgi:lysophospholipid acyltransferase (LPLAT)-like uncharacterized protein
VITETEQTSGQQNRSRFTLKQRILLSLITWAGFLILRAVGPTLRFAISWEDPSDSIPVKRPHIYSFWHSCMLPAMFVFRDFGIRVMSSDSFDGEYTGRIMMKFGFVKVRGSSTRGAIRGLIGMRKALEDEKTIAFTIDGPKGPRYVAKPGPVLLSRATGVPMSVFHVALDQAWVLNTWDKLMIPKPFSRALVRFSREMLVPAEADEAQREASLSEMQAALDRVREFAEASVKRVGSSEFPVVKVLPEL